MSSYPPVPHKHFQTQSAVCGCAGEELDWVTCTSGRSGQLGCDYWSSSWTWTNGRLLLSKVVSQMSGIVLRSSALTCSICLSHTRYCNKSSLFPTALLYSLKSDLNEASLCNVSPLSTVFYTHTACLGYLFPFCKDTHVQPVSLIRGCPVRVNTPIFSLFTPLYPGQTDGVS